MLRTDIRGFREIRVGQRCIPGFQVHGRSVWEMKHDLKVKTLDAVT